MSTITALIIPAERTEPVRTEQIVPDLATLQKLVGGYIERVPGGPVAGTDGRWHCYIDEEGKIKQRPANARATSLMRLAKGIFPWDHINGDLVLVGNGDDGEPTDSPDAFTAADGPMEAWNRHAITPA